MKVLTNEAAVLLALGEGPASGVGLTKRLRREAGQARSLGPGTLYPLLRRLEEAGLVRRWAEERPVGVGRPRRFVELTARGIGERKRVLSQIRAFGGSTSGTAPGSAVRRMRANLRRAFRISAFATQLRGAEAR